MLLIVKKTVERQLEIFGNDAGATVTPGVPHISHIFQWQEELEHPGSGV